MSDMDMVLTHKWEDKGLGKAPFRVVGFFSFPSPSLAEANVDAYNNALRESSEVAKRFGVGGGICDVCGMALMNNYVIRSADQKAFVVGCDCVGKTDDTQLISKVEANERKRKREAARVKRAAKAASERAAREAAYAAHQAHGEVAECPWCIAEARERAQVAARAEKAAAVQAENGWLLAVLDASRGGFVADMVGLLRQYPVRDLSRGQVRVLRDIYARETSGKRAGTEGFEVAAGEFDRKAFTEQGVSIP